MKMIEDIVQFFAYLLTQNYSIWFFSVPMAIGILSIIMMMVNSLSERRN